MVVVVCGDNNYENAYASHYFLFIKRHFLMAFSEKKNAGVLNPTN